MERKALAIERLVSEGHINLARKMIFSSTLGLSVPPYYRGSSLSDFWSRPCHRPKTRVLQDSLCGRSATQRTNAMTGNMNVSLYIGML